MGNNIVQQLTLMIIAIAIICKWNINKYKKIKIKTLDKFPEKERQTAKIIIDYINECQKTNEISIYIYIITIIGIMSIFFQNK